MLIHVTCVTSHLHILCDMSDRSCAFALWHVRQGMCICIVTPRAYMYCEHSCVCLLWQVVRRLIATTRDKTCVSFIVTHVTRRSRFHFDTCDNSWVIHVESAYIDVSMYRIRMHAYIHMYAVNTHIFTLVSWICTNSHVWIESAYRICMYSRKWTEYAYICMFELNMHICTCMDRISILNLHVFMYDLNKHIQMFGSNMHIYVYKLNNHLEYTYGICIFMSHSWMVNFTRMYESSYSSLQ